MYIHLCVCVCVCVCLCFVQTWCSCHTHVTRHRRLSPAVRCVHERSVALLTARLHRSHPLQQTHLVEVGAGVGQPLQSVCQVKVSAEVEAVCTQHAVNHGQESLVLLRLGEKRKAAALRKMNRKWITVKPKHTLRMSRAKRFFHADSAVYLALHIQDLKPAMTFTHT